MNYIATLANVANQPPAKDREELEATIKVNEANELKVASDLAGFFADDYF